MSTPGPWQEAVAGTYSTAGPPPRATPTGTPHTSGAICGQKGKGRGPFTQIYYKTSVLVPEVGERGRAVVNKQWYLPSCQDLGPQQTHRVFLRWPWSESDGCPQASLHGWEEGP